MSTPIQKSFKHWFGEILAEFLDREMELHAEALLVVATLSPAVPVRDGKLAVLTARVMAALLRCDVATINNWVESRTVAQTDRLALFFAHFPAPAVESAVQHLESLRPGNGGTDCVAQLRGNAARAGSAASRLVEVATDATADGRLDAAEMVTTHQATAALRAVLDQVDADADRCAANQTGRPVRGKFPRPAVAG